MKALIRPDELRALESAVSAALVAADARDLRILGYGEISAVVAWPTASGEVAAKRLPVFSDRRRFTDYEACVHQYLAVLRERGITPAPTELHSIDNEDGTVIGYCVQPVLDGDALGPKVLVRAGESERERLFNRLFDHVSEFIADHHGLDAQLSNWILGEDGDWIYLDITTPMMRDESGREKLDTALFLASLPWLLRPIVKRFMLGSILATYYGFRTAAVDLLANLYKEGAPETVPPLLEMLNRRFDDSIEIAEVARYYRSDARTWSLLQRLRRADRGWQRRVRRRVYPFLLPGKIERNIQ